MSRYRRLKLLTGRRSVNCADRRDAAGQMALFTADTHFVVYMDAKNATPSQELHSRDALAPDFENLNRYHATMHFLGQSTITSLSENHATGDAYCLARHLTGVCVITGTGGSI